MTAGCKFRSGWLSARAVAHRLPFQGDSILPSSRRLAHPGLGQPEVASPCLYLPKLSALPPLPCCTHICSACFFPFSVTALLLPSSACQTPHSWRELQAGRTGGAWRVTVSSPGGLPGGGGALCLCRWLTLQHAPVGRVGDGIDVGWHLVPLLALVHLNDLLRVDRQLLVGVHHHTEEARVRLQKREPSLL